MKLNHNSKISFLIDQRLRHSFVNFFINLFNTKGGRHSGGVIGKTSLGIQIQDDEDKSKLVIDWYFPFGDGISNNINSGLLRNLKYILKAGKPLGNFVYTFYEENNKHFVLGTLCKSEKKLIFFPGGDSGKLISKDETELGHIDHFTLDENLDTGHVTLKEKSTEGKKIPKYRTWRINDNLILWFVLQTPSIVNFEKVPKTLQTEITHKDSEVRRRAIAIFNAREGSKFQICKLDEKIEEPFVRNFEFFISLNGKPDLREIPVYYNKMSNPLPNTGRMANRVHDISIPDYDLMISIRVTKIRGSHYSPWSFNPGSSFINSKPADFDDVK